MPAWLGLLLLVIPVLLAAIFGTRQVKESKQARQLGAVPDGWVSARGVVVDERTSRRRRKGSDGTPQPIRQPIITFQSADGREITFSSRIHAPGMPRPGTLVEIYHDPIDPTRACIAPESLGNVVPPLGLAEKYVIGNIWFLAVVVTVIFAVVLFDA
jgi:Protein of unknown function (DUF3592)